MDTTKEAKMMVGTEGGLDYAVVAIRKGAGLGVKPFFVPFSGNRLLIAARVRCAPLGAGDAHFPDGLAHVFDGIAWEISKSTHARTHYHKGFVLEDFEAGFLPAAATFVDELFAEFHKHGALDDAEAALAREYLMGRFQEGLEKCLPMKAEFPPVPDFVWKDAYGDGSIVNDALKKKSGSKSALHSDPDDFVDDGGDDEDDED